VRCLRWLRRGPSAGTGWASECRHRSRDGGGNGTLKAVARSISPDATVEPSAFRTGLLGLQEDNADNLVAGHAIGDRSVRIRWIVRGVPRCGFSRL
jgi:hypothetical protein